MKKLFVLMCIFAAIFCAVYGHAAPKDESVTVYFLDRRMHTLVPVEYTVKASSSVKTANKIISILENKKSDEVINLLPPDSGVSVKQEKNTAVVNIPTDCKFPLNSSYENERLFVYQLVNSLTSIDGIDYVKFTVQGKSVKKLLGFLDMREIFTADYDI